jgi:branched-chain amino acid transport system permease protein
VLGLQLVMGLCGQISFGQVAFMAVGAYTSGILTLDLGWPFWIAMPAAGLTAGVIGIIGGAPSLRIKGFYLALATIAVHFIITWLVMHLEITGTTDGLHPPFPSIGDFVFDTDERLFYIIVPVMLLMTYFAKNLARSRVGRAFVAIRDNDLAAKVMGVNIFYYKLLAFFIACFYAGIAGSLSAHYYTAVNVEQFPLTEAVYLVGMLIVGGLGSITGVFFGVIFIRLLDELVIFGARPLAQLLPFLGLAAALSVSAFGLILMLFLIFLPRGLAHRWEIFKASYRLYPFAY